MKDQLIPANTINQPVKATFLQLVRQIENAQLNNAHKITLSFAANPSLDYPMREVEQINYINSQCIEITTNFFSLIGATGVLPTHYSEQILAQLKQKNPAIYDFYNLFHNRLHQLYYAAWRQQNLNADYEMARINPHHRSKTVSLLCDLLGIPYQVNHFMLNHSGNFISANHSTVGLQKLLSEELNLSIAIIPFLPFKQQLATESKSILSRNHKKAQHNRLGKDWIIGQSVRLDHAYFKIEIHAQNFQEYCQIVFNESTFQRINYLTRSYVGNAFKFVISTELPLTQRPTMQLHRDNLKAPKLGKSSFVTNRYKNLN